MKTHWNTFLRGGKVCNNRIMLGRAQRKFGMALWACALREYQVVKGWAEMDISRFSFFHIHPLPFAFCKSTLVLGFGAS